MSPQVSHELCRVENGFCKNHFVYVGGQARRTDPATSHQAAKRVRPGGAKMALLRAHYDSFIINGVDGLTDEEAARLAGLSMASEYATRCSELMRAGLLTITGATRAGASGMQREVRQITEAGLREVAP